MNFVEGDFDDHRSPVKESLNKMLVHHHVVLSLERKLRVDERYHLVDVLRSNFSKHIPIVQSFINK